ncbi:MAG TPA: ADP-ribosylglycohydrolase family protein [Kofleriaceae bacterium]|nr:ADP-ribosylglycohydrolase family protein [Kofleriaceae bacterium]
MIPGDRDACLARARRSLEGLSVGDAFGETFFPRKADIFARRLAGHAPWRWTDDTAMAVAIVAELAATGDVDPDALARRFADHHAREPWRGYGATAQDILTALADGVPWRVAARAPFGGEGSKGNGSAMRVAPLGAYFAHDLDTAIAAAVRSARPTHLHREAEAGAIAVAVAAALVARMAAGLLPRDGRALLAAVWEHTPTSLTRDGLDLATRVRLDAGAIAAGQRLGNGARVLCEDTVPFCLWIVAHHLDSYEEALWATLQPIGDIDTTCAIVGGILAAGDATIPPAWLAAREPLP